MIRVLARISGKISIYLFANVLAAVIPFALMPILTRVLTPQDYGTIAMFGLMLSIFGALAGLSVHGAVSIRYFQMGTEGLARYVGACVSILIASMILMLLIVQIAGQSLESVTGVPQRWLSGAVAAAGFQFLMNIRLVLWQVTGDAKKYGIFQVSFSAINAGLSLLLVVALGMSWPGRTWGQLLALASFGALSVILLYSDDRIARPTNWRRDVGDALHYGVPLIPHVLGGLAVVGAGRLIVTQQMGLAATGLYTVAMQCGLFVSLVADAFVKVYGPWLYGQLQIATPKSRLFVVGVTYVTYILFLLGALVFCGVVELFFPYFVGPEFLSAKNMIVYFVLGSAFTGMYYAVAGFFFFTSNTKYVSIVTVLSGFLSIALCWLLVGRYGVLGGAIGFLISQVVKFILAWVLSCKIYPMPWRDATGAFREVALKLQKK